MKYYRMLDSLAIEDRWFLGNMNFTNVKDLWLYKQAKRIQHIQADLTGQITEPGKELDITMAAFEILVANEKAASIFPESEIQKIPLKIEGSANTFFIIQVLNEIDCVDEAKSDFKFWEKDNAIRPDLYGEYKSFLKLIIKPEGITKDIFRVKKFDVAVIVSETIVKKIDNQMLTGIRFTEVC